MLSNHLRFGLPLLLFALQSPSLSCLPSCTFSSIPPTFAVPLNISFFILSCLVTPLIYLNILVSAPSNFLSCASLLISRYRTSLLVLQPACILYPALTLKLIVRSHRSPETPYQFSHPDCILCVIFSSKSPFSANVALNKL